MEWEQTKQLTRIANSLEIISYPIKHLIESKEKAEHWHNNACDRIRELLEKEIYQKRNITRLKNQIKKMKSND